MCMIYNKNIKKMVEIGLGCNMQYGAGHSIPFWKEVFDINNIFVFEYDKNCVINFNKSVKYDYYKSFIGDQGDSKDLQTFGNIIGEVDLIVDDGGHSMKQQITSLIYLFKHLSKWGMYVIEDMHSCYYPEYQYFDIKSCDFISDLIKCLHTNKCEHYNDERIQKI